MVIAPVSPDEISGVFYTIKPYIQRMHDRFNTPHPDEIYEALLDGQLTLHSIPQEGFFIAEWDYDECFILLACAIKGITTRPICDIIRDTDKEFKQLGVRKISFIPARKGWERLAEKAGFVQEGDFYVRYIRDGAQEEGKKDRC